MGALGAGNGERSGPPNIDGLAPIAWPLSAFGPVGIFVPTLLGDVLIDEDALGPIGIAFGETSLAGKGT